MAFFCSLLCSLLCGSPGYENKAQEQIAGGFGVCCVHAQSFIVIGSAQTTPRPTTRCERFLFNSMIREYATTHNRLLPLFLEACYCGMPGALYHLASPTSLFLSSCHHQPVPVPVFFFFSCASCRFRTPPLPPSPPPPFFSLPIM